MQSTDDIRMAFKRKLMSDCVIGKTLNIKLSKLPFREAASLARSIATRKRWSISIAQTADGIAITRNTELGSGGRQSIWDFSGIDLWATKQFNVPISEHHRLRSAASSFGKRYGVHLSVRTVRGTSLVNVTKVPANTPREYRGDPAFEVHRVRDSGTYPFATLDEVGKWFFVWTTEQLQPAISARASQASQRLGWRFSVRKSRRPDDDTPMGWGYCVIRVA